VRDAGRLSNRLSMAHLLQSICAGIEAEERFEDDVLIDATFEEWETFRSGFETLREKLLRRDSDLAMLPRLPGHETCAEAERNGETEVREDKRTNRELFAKAVFGTGYYQMREEFLFQQALSLLRALYLDGENKELPDAVLFNSEVAYRYADFVTENFKHHGRYGTLMSVFYGSSMQFKSLKRLRKFIAQDQFSLPHFRVKLETLLVRWQRAALTVPSLVRVGYPKYVTSETDDTVDYAYEDDGANRRSSRANGSGPLASQADGDCGTRSPKTSGRRARLGPLASQADGDRGTQSPETSVMRHRARLASATGALTRNLEDPLAESIALARRAANGQTLPSGTPPSRMDVEFDMATTREEGINLSGLPPSVRLQSPHRMSMMTESSFNHSKSSKSPRNKKRKWWTESEKMAVREGVRKLGAGDWVGIKKEYEHALQERTSVQIKDCYRTMKKRREISSSESE